MNASYNNRKLELLAPVGTMADFEQLLQSGADAFYMGGKQYNMRMHRKDHNLTMDELAIAAYLAHVVDKKVYITVNNMMSDEDMAGVGGFLASLEKIQPDGIILQDMGVVKTIRDEGLNLDMHLSVMANVHNMEMVRMAKDLGIARVVVSRELSLKDVTAMVREMPEMEYEYFIHGDMCSVHGSQCHYSGMVFGKSSNRGLCMKPCRWAYDIDGIPDSYGLAVKDMSLYRHIPELVSSGVNSFKIEGRMRGSEFLRDIINDYREAIDRYVDDPAGYMTDSEVSKRFQDTRVRNLSTAYAFKKPGAANIDMDGSREPRIFSRAVEEPEVENRSMNKQAGEKASGLAVKPKLAVKVNNLASSKAAVENGADKVYLAGETYRPDKPFTIEEIREAAAYARDHGAKAYYVLPRMVFDNRQVELTLSLEKMAETGLDGFVISNFGEIATVRKLIENRDLEIRGDYSLNVYNCKAAKFYSEQGLSSVTGSIEAPMQVLGDFLENADLPMEVIVQGAPCVMYMEHCIAAAREGVTSEDFCPEFCGEGDGYSIKDEKGNEHPVRFDRNCRNHILTVKDTCLLPVLDQLAGAGCLRIEGQHYNEKTIAEVTQLYRKSIDGVLDMEIVEAVTMLKEMTGRNQRRML